ncbi:hypothetical protein XH98_30430 [Bradyrhizobium sp. CCBAU 51745]|nr:hypothetical protein [Bradyrhizobium sp. CCBAU 51745]
MRDAGMLARYIRTERSTHCGRGEYLVERTGHAVGVVVATDAGPSCNNAAADGIQLGNPTPFCSRVLAMLIGSSAGCDSTSFVALEQTLSTRPNLEKLDSALIPHGYGGQRIVPAAQLNCPKLTFKRWQETDQELIARNTSEIAGMRTNP